MLTEPGQLATSRGVIEVRIRELAQLFNSLDPSPFHERDLDDDAEAYIVDWARELPADTRLTLVVHLPEAEAAKAEERGLAMSRPSSEVQARFGRPN